MKEIELYTDGACSGNPGPGGWGAILRWAEHERELSGGESDTTNNRMELTAVIQGLMALKERCNVTLYTDSKYIEQAFSQGWLSNWKKNGWKKSDKKPVLNRDLWEQLDKLFYAHNVKIIWVKGHADNELNNRCDILAVAQTKKLQKGL